MNGLQETVFRNGRLILDEEVPGDFVPAGNNNNGSLMSDGRTTRKISRQDLEFIPLPEATDTFQPIAHKALVDALDEALALRRFRIVKAEFAASPDGMKLFGLLEINAVTEGVRFAIGLRNSNDKSMRLGLVAGYRVRVCDNMMFCGDFNPLLAKHTKGLDLIESVSVGIDRIHRGFEPLGKAIRTKRLMEITDDEAKVLIYQAFLEERFPISLIKDVHRNYFSPEWEDFRDRTLWSLENAFTESFKELNPLAQYQTTARLGKFIAPLVEASLGGSNPTAPVAILETAQASANGGDWQ
jgi:hypothetical protein